jgi:uracil-DNA glycosylase family 4
MSRDQRAELAGLAAALRGHLESELELGLAGLTPWDVPRPTRGALQPGAAGPPVAPALAAERGPEPAPRDSEEKHHRLTLLAAQAAVCTACGLHEKRTQSVFSRGSPDAELVFIGEGPGQEEDRKGIPFVGPAGQLLDRMIEAMGFGRDEVYVCNIVKCRPPDNRTPRPEEAIACARFLAPQLELVAPKMMVALGRCAAENLGVAPPTGGWRGRFGSWRGITVMATYHPAYLLRSPEYKRVVWEDLQQVMARLGRTRQVKA